MLWLLRCSCRVAVSKAERDGRSSVRETDDQFGRSAENETFLPDTPGLP